VMFTGLFIVDPKIALSTLVVFGLIGFSLYKLMHKYARRLGLAESELTIGVNEKIVEVLVSYRESVVRNRRYYYSKEIEKSKYRLSNTLADISFLPSITKYVIETTVIIGTLAISVVLFLSQDATHAVATLAVFMASVTRIAPAVMRIQQGAIGIRQSLGTAQPTLALIESLQENSELDETENLLNTEHHGFQGIVELRQLSFKYPTKQDPVLKSIDLKVKEGEFLAIVGSSGAGKTTLVDVILGVLKQDSGEIYISGKPPLDSISTWPGAISYVPQDVVISSGNIRENVSLGLPSSEAHDAMVWRALETAQLSEFVKQLPFGLETQVGERGTKLSGGQRQRLGIARAMFTQPKLLVLDEATSSLDGQTEADISEAIQSLKGSVTIIMIAHRLSTVRNASRMIYMSEGSVLASGTFEEVRKLVPDFDRQASLMGLK